MGAWLNVTTGLMRTKPTSQAKVLKQPIFSNPLVTNTAGHPLGVSALSKGRTIAKAGCTKIKDLWDEEDWEWKSLPALEMNSHIINRRSRNTIISNIPWNPTAFPNHF